MNNLSFDFFCKRCTQDKAYREANCFTSYRIARYAKGEYIAYRGESVRAVGVLIEGSIEVETVLDSGMLLTSRIRKAPFAIGSVAIFADPNTYRVNIKANEDCAFCVVDRADIEAQMVSCRTFMRGFISHNVTMLDVFSKHLSLLSHKSLSAKLAAFIFSRSDGKTFHFDKKIGEIATYLCVERPSLSRLIAQFVEQKYITYDRGEGEILNPVALKNILE